jgi:hypothetical protein
MRLLPILLLFALAPLYAQTSDEKDAVDTVQKTFDGMAAHDAAMIRSTMLPDARLHPVPEKGDPALSTSGEDFANRIASIKEGLIERFTKRPRVLIHGRIAQVWGEYEFLRDGKFNHCGVDSFSLLKTSEGWKIASISYSSETTGCKGR